ncbi:YadA-like family protein [Luteimonas sp. SMYT11W]|uniref:YadA-like family protein n=1 Tax=Luteimonas flava TaxID=3115822 RepID=A0ABU7WGM4_9GAMM
MAAQEFTVTDGDNDAVVGQGGTVTFTGDPNIRVTQTGSNDDAEIVIQLARDIDVDTVTAGATRLDTNGVAVGTAALRGNGLTLGAGAPSITTAGIQAGNLAITGVGNGTAADHAVNFSQLQAVQAQAGAGWNVAVGANAYNIGPDGRVTFSGDANLGVALTGADDAAGVALTLNRNLNIDSVAAGTTSLTGTGVQVGSAVRLISTGLTITGGPSVTTAGINAGNRVITNVADGAVSATSTEAVNGRQIFALRQELFVEGEGVKYFHANSTLADSRSEGLESVAIGPRTVAEGSSSFAAGDGAATSIGATAGIAVGQGATVGTAAAAIPDGVGAVAIGRNAAAAGTSTISLGDGARVGSEFVSNALAIGTGASVTGAQSNSATAIGFQANASAGNATALGALASASGGGSIAIGQASASGGNTFAAGNGAQAASPNGIALGTGAGVGTNGTEAGDRTSHIAIGTGAGTAVVGNQTTAIGFQAGTGVLGDQNIAIGSQAGTAVEGDFNIAIGYRANQNVGEIDRGTALGALASTTSDSVAIGYNARTTGVSAVALGAEASAAGQGVALGRSAFAEGGSAALGFNSRAAAADAVGTSFLTGNTFGDGTVVSVGNTAANLQRRIVNVADGAQGFDAVNVNQLRAAQTATANLVGGNVIVNPNGSYGGYVIELTDIDGNTQRYSTVAAAINAVSSGAVSVMPGNAVIYNPDGTITTGTATLGDQAVNLSQLNAAIDANASRYVSINSADPSNRDNSGASGANAIAIGPQADADGAGGMSVGYQARSVGDAASALGNDVAALGNRSTAIGSSSQAYDDGTVAIGDRAVANGLNSVVIGTNAQADRKSPNDTVDNAVVIGTDAEVTADNGIAVGNSALASERNAVAHGFDAHAVAESAVATGTRARASGVNALASGTDSAASGFNSIASGTDSRGLASNSVAIGTGAVSGFSPQPGAEGFNVNTIAIGNGARAVYQDATAIGRASLASEVAATAIGDAATASEEAALAVGRNANASGVSAIAQGDGATASALAAQAQGRGATASGISSLAQGDGAQASETNATAVGHVAQATQASATAVGDDARATGINAIAAGRASRASGAASAAFGNDAQATLANTLALGGASRATAAGASAVGSDAQATAAGATALGQGTRATHANSVALGHNAVTAAAVATLNGTIDNVVYTYAGTAPVATVSVGTGTEKRTITNVAAGQVNAASTDAINGSQLFSTQQAVTALGTNVDSLGSSTAAALGGTSAYNPTTHQVTAGLAVGGTQHTSVQSALNQVNATANAGWNVGVNGETTRANVGPGGNVDFRNTDDNIEIARTGTNLVFNLADEITVNRLTAGNTVIDTTGVAVGNAVKLGDTGLVIAGGPSVTTAGINAGGQKITNVAAGTAPTDAVNVSQLSNTINASTTRYYSVNDNGVQGGNYANDGATGVNAIAIGVNTTTAGASGVAVGDGASTSSAGGVSIGKGAAARAQEGDVALGSGSVTDAVVGTAGATLNGTAYTFAGATPTSTVSVGSVGAERTVTNVAAGRISATSTDAINGSQLHATNTALDAVAGVANAGWNVTAAGVNGSNVGVNSPTGNTVDFKSGDGNIVVSKTVGNNDVSFDLADDLEVAGSVKVGDTVIDTTGVTVGSDVKLGDNGLTIVGGPSVTVDGIDAGGSVIRNVAAGVAVTDAVNVGQLNNTIETSRIKYFSVNDNGVQGGNYANDGASGINAVAIGVGTIATGDASYAAGAGAEAAAQNAVAIGNGTRALGASAIALGRGAIASDAFSIAQGQQATASTTGAIAMGVNATSNGVHSVALGSNTQALHNNSVALGASSVTADAVATTGVTINGTDYLFAGSAPTSTISVGRVGEERTITNVAAGRISATSTDAINGSQLNATNTALAEVATVANAGWNVTAEGANGSNVGLNSATGNTVDFKSGDGNIVVSKTVGSNDVSFGLADDLDIAGSVKVGDTLIDTMGVAIGTDVKLGNTGLTIVGGPSVTLAGIDAGGSVITNVAAGSAPTDAVNVSQLTDTVETNRTKYYSVNSTGGGNFNNEGATGDDAIAAGKDATAEGDEAVALGIGSAATGDGGIAIGARAQALSLNSLAIGAGAVSSHANSIALGAGSATTVGAQTGYQGAFVGSSDSTGELNVGGRQITGVAAGSAATDAVNVSQLQGGVDYAITQSNSYTDGQIDGVNNRIDVIDGRVTAIEGDIIDIQGDITDIQGDIVDIRGDITDLDDRVSNVEGVVVEVGGRLDSLETGASGPFQISQGEAYVAPTPSGQNASAGGNGAVASGNNSVALGNQSQATGAGSTAVGQGAKATATNSTALGQGATASHANSVALGAGSATTVGAQSNYNGAYVGTSSSTGEVNVGGRTISGVAPGIAGTDAVNVNQLTGGVNQAINVANQYTDGRITQIQDDMWSIERGYRGATSSAMAMAGLPQAYLPGKSMLAVGVGGYQSEYGMAVGLSGITENGRYVYRAQASGNTARDWGFSVGAGIQW